MGLCEVVLPHGIRRCLHIKRHDAGLECLDRHFVGLFILNLDVTHGREQIVEARICEQPTGLQAHCWQCTRNLLEVGFIGLRVGLCSCILLVFTKQ
jgi:hypothetical protein